MRTGEKVLCLHLKSIEPYMRVFVKNTIDCIHICMERAGPCRGSKAVETTLIDLLRELARKHGLGNVIVETDEGLGDFRNAGDLMKHIKSMVGGRS